MERKSAWFFLFASTRRREWAAGQITFLRLIRKVPKKFFNSFADIRMFKIYYTLMNRIYICRNCHKSCVAVIFTQHFPIPILQCLGNKLRLSFDYHNFHLKTFYDISQCKNINKTVQLSKYFELVDFFVNFELVWENQL